MDDLGLLPRGVRVGAGVQRGALLFGHAREQASCVGIADLGVLLLPGQAQKRFERGDALRRGCSLSARGAALAAGGLIRGGQVRVVQRGCGGRRLFARMVDLLRVEAVDLDLLFLLRAHRVVQVSGERRGVVAFEVVDVLRFVAEGAALDVGDVRARSHAARPCVGVELGVKVPRLRLTRADRLFVGGTEPVCDHVGDLALRQRRKLDGLGQIPLEHLGEDGFIRRDLHRGRLRVRRLRTAAGRLCAGRFCAGRGLGVRIGFGRGFRSVLVQDRNGRRPYTDGRF